MKIDSKLLRALLKAGFPLKPVPKELLDLGIVIKKLFPTSIWLNGKLYLSPTLEDAFNAIKRYRFLSFGRNPKEWNASVTGAAATGKTPLEVLLKLFLKLKKTRPIKTKK